MTIQTPLFRKSELEEIETHLSGIAREAEEEIARNPSSAGQIRAKAKAASENFIAMRVALRRKKNYEAFVWGELFSAILWAIGFMFGVSWLGLFGLITFIICVGNAIHKGSETGGNSRFHGLVFAGSLLVFAFGFFISNQKHYEPDGIYVSETKRGSVTLRREVKSGIEMLETERKRTGVHKKTACVLVLAAIGFGFFTLRNVILGKQSA